MNMTLFWIIIFGLLMSCIALVGSLTLFLRPKTWSKLILPLVAFAAGSLIGGALLHMIPAAVRKMGNVTALYVWLVAGFMVFYALEEFLNWHHSHTHGHSCGPLSSPHQHCMPQTRQQQSDEKSMTHICGLDCELACNVDTKDTVSDANIQNVDQAKDIESYTTNAEGGTEDDLATTDDSNEEQSPPTRKPPLVYLILVADAVHNFLGGMFVGASFVDSFDLGISAWLAAAAHEVPQELGDFAVLVHSGLSKRRALLLNFLSALSFPIGSIIAYAASKAINVSFLIPFAAGNFLYIGASDLIPETKHCHGATSNAVHFLSFSAGVGIMLGVRVALDGW